MNSWRYEYLKFKYFVLPNEWFRNGIHAIAVVMGAGNIFMASYTDSAHFGIMSFALMTLAFGNWMTSEERTPNH